MNNAEHEVILVLGIRPDIIRSSIIIEKFRSALGHRFALVWSGQHYSSNLKDVFFSQLNVDPPDFELSIKGDDDSELVSSMISNLHNLLMLTKPKVVLFLGDTNTVMGAVASAQLNIPTFHIEGCMRSYDWRMPEEKYRTVVDHLSDRIYAYLEEYKSQGLAEGMPQEIIMVTGNPIVDVLETYFMSGKLRFKQAEKKEFLNCFGLSEKSFVVLTSHRRENIQNELCLKRILDLAETVQDQVLFPAGYRTQKMLKEFKLEIPSNVNMIDPIGYLELLELMTSSYGVLTDSGTIVEEASILGIPSIQMRHSTERPQVYDIGASLKFDPMANQPNLAILNAMKEIVPKSWQHGLGDGNASARIVEDVIQRLEKGDLTGHKSEYYAPFSNRSFTG